MNYTVDFYSTKRNGKQKKLFQVKYDGKQITSNKNKLNIYLINSETIIGKGGKELSIKKDGLVFMENLKYAFTGSMFRAGDVKKQDS